MLFHRYAVPAIIVIALALAAAFVVACGGPRAEPTAMPAATQASQPSVPGAATEAPPAAATDPPPATATVMAAATAEPAATQVEQAMAAATEPPAESPTAEAAPSGAGAVFTLSEGTIARYRVEEELANTGFFVAVGETQDVAGRIAFDADGAVIAEESRIALQAATLRTDSNRRDGYVRSRTLETDAYPEVVFVPTAIDGPTGSIADARGTVEISIIGDLTVKGQTREVTWDGAADFPGDGTATGSVAVEFTFDDFGMDKPRVAIVLSVEDTIRLELDFAGTIE